jgi:thiol-disulfide isomerase/thioredoxin
MVPVPCRFASEPSLVHSLRTMPVLTSLILAAAVAAAPAPRPADADAVLAEVRKPGAAAVLVNVWATWCLPCREEFPDLMRVSRELSARGLRLVLVSADLPDAGAEVVQFLTEQGVDFPTLIKAGKDDPFVNALGREWTGAIPATFVYDAHGKLVRFWEGKADYETIKKRALKALEIKETP